MLRYAAFDGVPTEAFPRAANATLYVLFSRKDQGSVIKGIDGENLVCSVFKERPRIGYKGN